MRSNVDHAITSEAAMRMLPRMMILCTLCVGLASCAIPIGTTYSRDDLNQARATDQAHFEDSATVFFANYHNPIQDKDFLWFASFAEGPVELHVHNTDTDSLEAVYKFAPQNIPLYTLAQRREKDRWVKCVLFVSDRPKCAKLYQAWYPIEASHWKTQYTVEH